MYSPPMHSDATKYVENSSIPDLAAYQTLNVYSHKLGVPLKELRIKGCVLDVGCGPGTSTRILYDYLDPSASLDGCDISKKLLDKAKKINQDKNIDFFLLDANDQSEMLLNKYDFIFSNLVLHWIPNQRLVIQNIYNMLKENGKILVNFFSYNAVWDAYRDLSKMPKWKSYTEDVENYINPYQYDENADVTFKNILLECGFKRADVFVMDLDSKYSVEKCTYKTFRNNLATIDPFLPRIPVGEKESYVKDLMETVARNGGFKNTKPNYLFNDDEIIEVQGKLLVALAYK